MPTIITRGAASAGAFGFGSGGASTPTLIAPLGIVNKGSDGYWYIFNVETETFSQIPSSNGSTSNIQFDPITGLLYTQSDTSGSSQKYWTPNSGKTNWDYAGTFTQQGGGYNGVSGYGWNSANWNSSSDASGFSYAQINAIPNGTYLGSAYSTGFTGTEDAQSYGNVGYIGLYGSTASIIMSSYSSFTSQTSLAGQSNWGTLCYDNRTGLFMLNQYQGTNGYIYYNKYSANAYGAASSNENLSAITLSGKVGSNPIYGSFLTAVDTTAVGGSSSTTSYWQIDPSGTLYSGNSGSYGSVGTYCCKTSWVWSYKNKAYYHVGPSGAIKVTMTGPYQLSASPGFIGAPVTMQGWRGMRATNGQLPCYLFNKNALPFA